VGFGLKTAAWIPAAPAGRNPSRILGATGRPVKALRPALLCAANVPHRRSRVRSEGDETTVFQEGSNTGTRNFA